MCTDLVYSNKLLNLLSMDKNRSIHISKMPSAMLRHLNAVAKNAGTDPSKELMSFMDDVINRLGPITTAKVDGCADKKIHNIGIKQKRKLISIANAIGVPYGSLIKVLYHTERILPEAKRALANQKG